VIDLNARLARGPLRVRRLWQAPSPESFLRRLARRRRVSLVLDAVAACVCLAALLLIPWRARVAARGPLALTTLADGSTAEPTSRDSELRVEEESPAHTVVWLKGGARFQVVHDPQRIFEVRLPDVRARVLGTTFSVLQLPSGAAQVLVEHGRVEVAWLGGSTLLGDGEGGVFPPAERGQEVVEEAPPDVSPALSASSGAAPSPVATAPTRPTAETAWRDHARAGDYAKAYSELRAGGLDSVRDEAGDLLLAADAARLSGHPADAVRQLRMLCDRHSSDPSAPVAAFTLGRVLDDLGKPAEAAAAFRRAGALSPSSPLAEDALAREAEAWARAGRSDDARVAAARYFRRFPAGPHVADLRKILPE
jgi:transmembrane sensor